MCFGDPVLSILAFSGLPYLKLQMLLWDLSVAFITCLHVRKVSAQVIYF